MPERRTGPGARCHTEGAEAAGSRDDVRLEAMAAADLPEVGRIEWRCFPSPWPRRAFRHALLDRAGYCRVARLDDLIAGYLIGFFRGEEFLIANIAVRPELQRRGIGTRLLTDALQAAKGAACRYAVLSVRPSNSTAIRFYRRFGFSVARVVPRYYMAPREDAFVMRKELDHPTC